MRRSPMPRQRVPLRARRRPSPTAEIDARALVRLRSRGDCESGCGRPGTDWSHRVARSQGGPWCPSNGLLLCRWCHEWCHRHPEHATAAGLMLPGHADPLTRPVWLPGRWYGATRWRWMLLDQVGGIGSAQPQPAPPAQYPPDQYGSPRGWLLDPTEEAR